MMESLSDGVGRIRRSGQELPCQRDRGKARGGPAGAPYMTAILRGILSRGG